MHDDFIPRLVAEQPEGFSLLQPFYKDESIFAADLERVIGPQWLYVDHVSVIPSPGDYILYEFANESIIIVRDETGTVRAHFNVCRHRGSRVCLQPSGNVKRLVCPYHAWAYALDGSLQHARHMPTNFDAAQYGLKPCRLEILDGLIFVNLSDSEPVDFEELRAHVEPYVKLHGLAHTKVAHREVYPTYANWKLAVENFRECYHCAPAHPEYTQVNAYVRAYEQNHLTGYDSAIEAWAKQQADSGRVTEFSRWNDNPLQPHFAWRQPIGDGHLTLSENGKPCAPLIGQFSEYDGAETAVFFGCLSYLYMANDHATVFRFTPVDAHFTSVELTWLVHETAVEGDDYDVEKLKWMWHETTVQDTKIINDNQKGVNSSRYTPGPYSEQENGPIRFTKWYLDRLTA